MYVGKSTPDVLYENSSAYIHILFSIATLYVGCVRHYVGKIIPDVLYENYLLTSISYLVLLLYK